MERGPIDMSTEYNELRETCTGHVEVWQINDCIDENQNDQVRKMRDIAKRRAEAFFGCDAEFAECTIRQDWTCRIRLVPKGGDWNAKPGIVKLKSFTDGYMQEAPYPAVEKIADGFDCQGCGKRCVPNEENMPYRSCIECKTGTQYTYKEGERATASGQCADCKMRRTKDQLTYQRGAWRCHGFVHCAGTTKAQAVPCDVREIAVVKAGDKIGSATVVPHEKVKFGNGIAEGLFKFLYVQQEVVKRLLLGDDMYAAERAAQLVLDEQKKVDAARSKETKDKDDALIRSSMMRTRREWPEEII